MLKSHRYAQRTRVANRGRSALRPIMRCTKTTDFDLSNNAAESFSAELGPRDDDVRLLLMLLASESLMR